MKMGGELGSSLQIFTQVFFDAPISTSLLTAAPGEGAGVPVTGTRTGVTGSARRTSKPLSELGPPGDASGTAGIMEFGGGASVAAAEPGVAVSGAGVVAVTSGAATAADVGGPSSCAEWRGVSCADLCETASRFPR